MLAIKGIKSGLDLKDLDSSSLMHASISDTQNMTFMKGGIYEWGVPWMESGRIVIVKILKSLCKDEWILWCHGNEDSRLNHESFLAHGINPDRFRIAYTQQPMKDLKAAIVSPMFKFIVIDSASDLNDISLAFLHHKAKELKKTIFIVRPFFLSSKKGSIWSKMRFNIEQKTIHGELNIRSIKGHKNYSLRPYDVF